MKNNKNIFLFFLVSLLLIAVVILFAQKNQQVVLPYENTIIKNGIQLKYEIVQENKSKIGMKAEIKNVGKGDISWYEKTRTQMMYLYMFDKKSKKRINGGHIPADGKGGGALMIVGKTFTLKKGETKTFEEEIPLLIQVDEETDKPALEKYEGKVAIVFYTPEYEIVLDGEVESGILFLNKEKIIIGENKRS